MWEGGANAIRPHDRGLHNGANAIRPHDRGLHNGANAIRPYNRAHRDGARAARPYDLDNAVQVIGHHNEGVQFNFAANPRRPDPFFLYDSPQVVHLHLPVNDFPENALLFVRADGNEIAAGLRVIVTVQSNGPAVVNFRIEYHWPNRTA